MHIKNKKTCEDIDFYLLNPLHSFAIALRYNEVEHTLPIVIDKVENYQDEFSLYLESKDIKFFYTYYFYNEFSALEINQEIPKTIVKFTWTYSGGTLPLLIFSLREGFRVDL